MALADYYRRGAVAASQVLTGFDEAAFRSRLEATPVVVAVDRHAARSPDANHLLELLVRLLSRLYPSLCLAGSEGTAALRDRLATLARGVNPLIELSDSPHGNAVGLAVGRRRWRIRTLQYVGASGWDAFLDRSDPQPIGPDSNPFGAGAAAALAAGWLFRHLFTASGTEDSVVFSTLDGGRRLTRGAPRPRAVMDVPAALVGVGAIGNAAVWALARTELEGQLHLIDPESIELSNLQRYVLALRSDEGASKVAVGVRELVGPLSPVDFGVSWREYISSAPNTPSRVLLALDNANDRRLAQGGLPRWIANGWTQPGDLGVSTHPRFGGDGACVACLYLPDRPVPNADEVVAAALNIVDRVLDVRTLLHTNGPVPDELLTLIADRLGRPQELVAPYAGRPIRELYVEGVCGGAVLPLGGLGATPTEMHVPMAHQSALAGVLLGAALVRSVLGRDPGTTQATRVNVLRPLGEDLTQATRRRGDGRCICDDRDFVRRYSDKWDQ